MPMPSSTSTAATAARMPHPPDCSRAAAGFFRSGWAHSLLGDFTGAFAVCRSATSDCSSPSVAAVVAVATRCRCSSIDSWPSPNALSRTWQVSVRSLSFARVCRVATSTIVKVRPRVTADQMAIARTHLTPSRLRRRGADVLWSSCDCSDRWWTMRFGGGPCWPRSTRDAPASRRSAMPIPTCCGPRSSTGSPVR